MADVNDNSPVFIGAPYTVNISEAVMVGSDITDDILAVDDDQPGPFSSVVYSIPSSSPFSDFVSMTNPLQGRIVLSKSLDYESLQSFQVRLIAKDQGSPPRESETTITINVLDADDQNPVFHYDRYEALLPEHTREVTKLKVEPEDISAFDKDLGLDSPVLYTFSGTGLEYQYFSLNTTSGEIFLTREILSSEFSQPVTLVVKATEKDNPDRYSLTTLTVSRLLSPSSGDLSFLRSAYSTQVLENMPIDSAILAVMTNGKSSQRIEFFIDDLDLPGQEFSVSQAGDIVVRKQLDYEVTQGYSFRVMAIAGKDNATTRVNISVINVNDWDPRFRFPQYEFHVPEDHEDKGHKVGTVDVFDGDKGDQISLDITGPFARVFGITTKGDIFISDISYMTGTDAHLVVVAEDSGVPPRRASVPVVVRFAKEIASTRNLTEENPNLLLLLILSVVLVAFLLIIVSLGVYICKGKNYPKVPSPLSSDHLYSGHHSITYSLNSLSHQSQSNKSLNQRPLSISSDKSEVTTISTASTARPFIQQRLPQKQGNKPRKQQNKVAPLAQATSINECGLPTNPNIQAKQERTVIHLARRTNLQEELKTNILGSHHPPKRLEWPHASIPRTVKKLSWDDELECTNDKEKTTFMDPDVSVTPMSNLERKHKDRVCLK